MGLLANASYVDVGPLAWPRDGYLNATGRKASEGVRHPAALVGWDDELWLFWIDNGFDYAEVYVAQASAGAQQGQPSSFALHNASSGKWDVPTLPPSFTSGTFAAFLRTPSPAGLAPHDTSPTFVLAPTSGAVRFSAARLSVRGDASQRLYVAVYSAVNYTECFNGSTVDGGGDGRVGLRLAAEMRHHRPPGLSEQAALAGGDCVPTWSLFLRLTLDFVTWGDAQRLRQYDAPGWAPARLQYPALLNAAGDSHALVDSTGFFILGVCSTPDAWCNSTFGPLPTRAWVQLDVDV